MLPLIARYNHLRKVEITANMMPGISQGDAIQKSLEMARLCREELGLPESYRIVQMGNAKAMEQTMGSLWDALVLGFLVAYMILGIQFNSFCIPSRFWRRFLSDSPEPWQPFGGLGTH